MWLGAPSEAQSDNRQRTQDLSVRVFSASASNNFLAAGVAPQAGWHGRARKTLIQMSASLAQFLRTHAASLP